MNSLRKRELVEDEVAEFASMARRRKQRVKMVRTMRRATDGRPTVLRLRLILLTLRLCLSTNTCINMSV
jgi:hypothetical protein